MISGVYNGEFEPSTGQFTLRSLLYDRFEVFREGSVADDHVLRVATSGECESFAYVAFVERNFGTKTFFLLLTHTLKRFCCRFSPHMSWNGVRT